MKQADAVALVRYSDRYLEALNNFVLPEDQIQFSALPKEVLHATEGAYPIVILNEGEAVGFFMLHSSDRVKNYTDNPKAMLLAALSTDQRHQRKGYAKAGMLALPSFMNREFEFCNEVVLVVNHKNIPAQNLYMNAGFIDTGERRMGPIGEQFVLSLKIK